MLTRARNRIHNPTEALPIDLDLVSAKLLQLGANDAPGLREHTQSPEYSPTPPRPPKEAYREAEIAQHDELVADRGRPWFPLHLLEDVQTNQSKYSDSLRFWQSHGWKVYTGQLERWTEFRTWQREYRGIYDREQAFFTYREMAERLLARSPYRENHGRSSILSDIEDEFWERKSR